jgi:hypothetical protein
MTNSPNNNDIHHIKNNSEKRGRVEQYLQNGQILEQSQQNSDNDIEITTNPDKEYGKLFPNEKRNKITYFQEDKETEGLDFILFHFNQDKLLPRKIMTKKLGYQKEVLSINEILYYFQLSDFVDCRINAFPSYTEYKGIQRYPPDLIFIDLDRNNFDTDIGLDTSLKITLKNIKKELDGFPTVLKTGGGYHIILPVNCPIPLENIPELQGFDKPSEQFLRFLKDYLSNGKADKNNNPSFKSCLLRTPGSINSRYNTKVTIIQKWNRIRPNLSLELLLEFKRYLKQKDRQKRLLLKVRNRSYNNYDSKYYTWIENLLYNTAIPDCRKLVIDLILSPYLINIKQLSYEESYNIIKNWFDKCYNPKKDNYRNFEYRIKYSLKNAINKGIGPLSLHKIKTDERYRKLYILLFKDH